MIPLKPNGKRSQNKGQQHNFLSVQNKFYSNTRLIEQFEKKANEALNDNLEMRKEIQSFYQSAEIQLFDFLRASKNSKKQQWIQLCKYLVTHYINYKNSKICLHYYFTGLSKGDYQPLFPMFAYLEQQIKYLFVDEADKRIGSVNFQSFQSQKGCSERSGKFISVSQTSKASTKQDATEKNQMPLPNFSKKEVAIVKKTPLTKNSKQHQALKQSRQRQSQSSSNEQKSQRNNKLKAFESYFQMISTGNLQSANKNVSYRQFKQEFQIELEMISHHCQVVKNVIQYFNQTILKQQPLKQQADLNILKQCLQKVKRKQAMNQEIKEETKKIYKAQFQKDLIEKKRKKMLIESYTVLQSCQFSNVFDIGPSIQQLQQQLKQARTLFNKKSVEHSVDNRKFIELQKYVTKIELQNSQQKQKTSSLLTQIRQLQLSLSTSDKSSKPQVKEQQKQKQVESKNKKQNSVSSISSESQCYNCSALEQQNQKLKKQIETLKKQFKVTAKQMNQLSSKKQLLVNASSYFTKLNLHFQTSDILPPIQQSQFRQIVMQNLDNIAAQKGEKRKNIMVKLGNFFNEKEYLIGIIQKYVRQNDIYTNPAIKAFKLIYKFDHSTKLNFHEFIDHKPHFLVLIKLKTGSIVGGYSHQPLQKGLLTNLGFLFSISLMETYYLAQKYCLVYDDYYLVFGNSEIRIRVGQNTLYSNFAITNSHFNPNGRKVSDFLNLPAQRQLPFQFFEIFQVVFSNN